MGIEHESARLLGQCVGILNDILEEQRDIAHYLQGICVVVEQYDKRKEVPVEDIIASKIDPKLAPLAAVPAKQQQWMGKKK